MVSAVLIIGLVFVTDAKQYGDEDNWINTEKERQSAYLSDDDILYEGQCYFFVSKSCSVMFFKSKHSWSFLRFRSAMDILVKTISYKVWLWSLIRIFQLPYPEIAYGSYVFTLWFLSCLNWWMSLAVIVDRKFGNFLISTEGKFLENVAKQRQRHYVSIVW